MKQKKHRIYYKKNTEYTKFLDSQDSQAFEKYVQQIEKYCKDKKKSILDVGCGTGIVLEKIKSFAEGTGIDVSDTSIELCQKKNLKVQTYDGDIFPFKDEVFDIVGSFNVLEHVEDPQAFLLESMRVLKKKGHLFIICPNFLSVTNSYHYNTSGYKQKLSNALMLLSKIIARTYTFSHMPAVQKKQFSPDDDAITITNPADIIHFAKAYNLQLLYWSSQQQNGGGLQRVLDRGILRYFLGACFFVFRKI